MRVIDTERMECSCGCGQIINSKDKWGRAKSFVSGHNGRKYTNPTQYKREWNYRNRESRYIAKIKRGHELKVKSIGLLGKKCTVCGLKYNGKNACVFQFHHKDSKEKEFPINTRTLINYSWQRIINEITKCDLLCANCHFILHNEEY